MSTVWYKERQNSVAEKGHNGEGAIADYIQPFERHQEVEYKCQFVCMYYCLCLFLIRIVSIGKKKLAAVMAKKEEQEATRERMRISIS